MKINALKKLLNGANLKKISSPYSMGEKINCLWEILDNNNSLLGKYVLLGVPDDRGVIASGGCGGAKEGPNSFRTAFYKLYDTHLREYNSVTHHPFPPSQKKREQAISLAEKFVDAGDIKISDTIAQTHENIAHAVQYFLSAGVDAIFVIGGGQDFSYGSYKGHVAARKNDIIPIINFGAHFGLRPVENDIIHNDSAFFRIIQDFPKNIAQGQALLEIGIQRERNPHFLYEFAEKNKIPVVEYLVLLNMWRDLQQAHSQLPLEHVRDHMDDCAELGFDRYEGSFHVSLCLDVFNQNVVPGTSASSPSGVQLHDITDSLVYFSKSRACRVVDIGELCPTNDFHDQTARLAASLVYRFALVREEYASR